MKLPVIFLLSCSLTYAQQTALPAVAVEAPPTSGLTNENPEDFAVQDPADESAATTIKKQEIKTIAIPKQGDAAVRLQIFLDQKNFGPGIIDGKPGKFTRLAIENYNTSLGRKKRDLRVVTESEATISQPYATAIIPEIASDFVDQTLPTKRELQAERTSMPYRSLTEFMAERYHASESLLIELNGAKQMRNAKPHTAIKVPNIKPFKIEDLVVGRSHSKHENLTARHMVVDTGTKQVYIYQLIIPEVQETEHGEIAVTRTIAKPVLIASFPITPGKTQFIPKGFWNLKNSVELPEWRYDKQLLETGVRGDEYLRIPPGPNNPVGIIWNGLTKSGIGIHGTDNPQTIGRARSAGCIRLANWDAARIPNLVRPGAVVVVK